MKGDTNVDPLSSLQKFWEVRGETGSFERAYSVRLQGITKIVKRIKKLVAGKIILDIGCGPGIAASIFPKDTKVIGLDFSASMLRSAKSHAWESILANALDLPFHNGVLDAAACLFVASDYSSKEDFFKEVYHVLKYNGLFFFADYSPNDGLWTFRKRIQPDYKIFLEGEETLTNKLERAGFEVQKSEYIRFNAPIDIERYIKSEKELEKIKKTDIKTYEMIKNLRNTKKIEREFLLLTSKKLHELKE